MTRQGEAADDRQERKLAVADHRRAPRRRGAVLEQAILAAAVEELRESGYSGLSLERVATRARTGNAAVYRRWPSRAELAMDAATQLALAEEELPDTGNLRSDMLAYLRQMAARLNSPLGELMRGLLVEMTRDTAFTQVFWERLHVGDPARVAVFLDRAVDRGEVEPWIPESRRATVAAELLRHHFFLFGAPIGDETIISIVDDVYLPLVLRPAPHDHRPTEPQSPRQHLPEDIKDRQEH
ncbi:TetR/AcrR family transcriptional regulator [Kibdelosporangium aridum]|uniref:TetR/AcrR family transcriptional regulator n=1 Tax=Kibdelosporangium aridum TaxID=2030 RepID=UPI0007C531D1